ncbi:MAG: ribonuclease III [Thermotogaceae bacterium]|nr:ribonuclease III [Thermotogaceae bacterium]
MRKNGNDLKLPEEAILSDFQRRLGVFFKDLSLLKLALSHSSWVYEQTVKSGEPPCQSNERLEFLGDAIVGFLVVEKLYRDYPSEAEGTLARIKAVMASEPLLSRAAKELEMGRYLFLGKGEIHSGGRERDSILADAFEAVCGAIYLDSGLEPVRLLLQRLLFPYLQDVFDDVICLDYKSKLQEFTQGIDRLLPEYRLVSVSGPSHRPLFIVDVYLESRLLARGEGRTKKEAEQNAAEGGIKLLVSEEKADGLR